VPQIRYTLGGVVASLAMIEERQTTLVETRTVAVDEKEASDKTRLIDEEVMVITQTPLTSSIKNTLRHLTTIGGFRARYRGLACALVYNVVHSLVVNFISVAIAAFTGLPVVGRVIANIMAQVLCARIHMVWTHIVVSEPSTTSWTQRLSQTDRNVFRALALPAFVHAMAELATYGLPLAMFLFVGPEVAGPNETEHMVCRAVISLVAFVMLNILILLPATVTRTRVEASFLPEADKTIVPFDRTFNGAVDMLSLDTRAGRKSLFVEAWRSFDMASRARLVRFFVKEAAIELFFSITAIAAISAQLSLLDMSKSNVIVNIEGM
jgi:hypothetical protein